MAKMTLKTQKALDYIMFMMIGSYFKKVECINNQFELVSKFLNYKYMFEGEQILAEIICDYFAEKKLKRCLPEDMWEQAVTADLLYNSKDKSWVRFSGVDFQLDIKAEVYSSKSIEFTYYYDDAADKHIYGRKRFFAGRDEEQKQVYKLWEQVNRDAA